MVKKYIGESRVSEALGLSSSGKSCSEFYSKDVCPWDTSAMIKIVSKLLSSGQSYARSEWLQICCGQQLVQSIAGKLEMFSNICSNLALCDSCCNLRLGRMRLKLCRKPKLFKTAFFMRVVFRNSIEAVNFKIK